MRGGGAVMEPKSKLWAGGGGGAGGRRARVRLGSQKRSHTQSPAGPWDPPPGVGSPGGSKLGASESCPLGAGFWLQEESGWGQREEKQESCCCCRQDEDGTQEGRKDLGAALEAESQGPSRAWSGISWGCRRQGSRRCPALCCPRGWVVVPSPQMGNLDLIEAGTKCHPH